MPSRTTESGIASPTSPRPVSVTPDGHAAELALARRLLHAEAAAISTLADAIGPGFHIAVDLIVRCTETGGTLLVTGLGKSGNIGQKIAATMTSLGITSHFVHPAEAAHGDLGRFRATDVCLALSYSGETNEVVDLAGILRQDGVPVISVTRGSASKSGAQASLERLATVHLAIGHCDDPMLTPAPTCSTTATLAIGDALAVCAARRMNFSDNDFARRHPGGSLGGLLRPLADILRFVVGKNVKPVPENVSIAQALAMAEIAGVRRPGALLLVSEATGQLTGIFTDADLRRTVGRDPAELARPIRELMTRTPSSLPASSLVRDAVVLVRESRLDEVPVVDAAGRPVGILDVQDLIALKLIQSE